MESGLWKISREVNQHSFYTANLLLQLIPSPLAYVNQPNALVATEVYQVVITNNVHLDRTGRRLYRTMLLLEVNVERLIHHTSYFPWSHSTESLCAWYEEEGLTFTS